ncbi:pyridoxal phosphate-dependent aminotransferase [Patescibacteria group bacterium]|nr:pyridoxal phosphate-dependent aminotransferase [Patescibacteria group bacterium]MBU1673877.1 pyridoxal phosphate-dependent aminotransferase [Patescibacteria group bacterium]MBU1963254.1 pyridoxal phosphate-dependent aminotransferase [Patescibacteria group bacterium]
MDCKICKKIINIAPSATLVLDKQAKDLIAKGEPVINLTAGELDFPAPLEIRKKVTKATIKGFNTYTPTGGLPELKKLICKKLKKDNKLSYKSDEVIVTNGAKQSLFNIFQVILGPGDEVIIPTPYWVSYVEQVKLGEGKAVLVPTDNNFDLNVDAVLKAINKKTKAIIINSPNNPTGKIYSEANLKKLAKGLKGKDVWVISDEIYEHLNYGIKPDSIARFYKQRTIIVNGFSKSHAITGWRVGYTVGNSHLIKSLEKLQSHSSGNVSNIMQIAAIEALKTGNKYPKKFIPELKKRRKYLIEKILKIPGATMAEPDGAFYVFFRIPGITDDSEKFCQNLLKYAKVAVVPGECFGKKGYIRLSYANSTPKIKEAISRIEKFIKNKP